LVIGGFAPSGNDRVQASNSNAFIYTVNTVFMFDYNKTKLAKKGAKITKLLDAKPADGMPTTDGANPVANARFTVAVPKEAHDRRKELIAISPRVKDDIPDLSSAKPVLSSSSQSKKSTKEDEKRRREEEERKAKEEAEWRKAQSKKDGKIKHTKEDKEKEKAEREAKERAAKDKEKADKEKEKADKEKEKEDKKKEGKVLCD
jgi:hypothetical protein